MKLAGPGLRGQYAPGVWVVSKPTLPERIATARARRSARQEAHRAARKRWRRERKASWRPAIIPPSQ